MVDPASKPPGGAMPPNTNAQKVEQDRVADQKQAADAQKSKQVQLQEKEAKDSEERQRKETEEREKASATPKEYIFDPSKPASYENARDQAARAQWQGRLRMAQTASEAALRARRLADNAIARGHSEATALDEAAKKAEEHATKMAAEVAPKPEPWNEHDIKTLSEVEREGQPDRKDGPHPETEKERAEIDKSLKPVK
jgi:fused signal recognition particle receptor